MKHINLTNWKGSITDWVELNYIKNGLADAYADIANLKGNYAYIENGVVKIEKNFTKRKLSDVTSTTGYYNSTTKLFSTSNISDMSAGLGDASINDFNLDGYITYAYNTLVGSGLNTIDYGVVQGDNQKLYIRNIDYTDYADLYDIIKDSYIRYELADAYKEIIVVP